LVSSVAEQESDDDSDAEAQDGGSAAASAQPELSDAQKEALWASLGLGVEDTNVDADGTTQGDASFNGVCSVPEEDAAVAATQYTTLSGYISRGDNAVDGASDSDAVSDSQGGSNSSGSDHSSSGSGSGSGSSSGEELEESSVESGGESGGGEAARGHSGASSANDADAQKRARSNSWSTADSMMAREGGQGRRRERSDSLVETVWDDPLIQEEEQQIACVKCTRVRGTAPRADRSIAAQSAICDGARARSSSPARGSAFAETIAQDPARVARVACAFSLTHPHPTTPSVL
jgi:hypothetical protein